jgi:hypothetical protein
MIENDASVSPLPGPLDRGLRSKQRQRTIEQP